MKLRPDERFVERERRSTVISSQSSTIMAPCGHYFSFAFLPPRRFIDICQSQTVASPCKVRGSRRWQVQHFGSLQSVSMERAEAPEPTKFFSDTGSVCYNIIGQVMSEDVEESTKWGACQPSINMARLPIPPPTWLAVLLVLSNYTSAGWTYLNTA